MLTVLTALAFATPPPLPEDAGRRDATLIPVDHPDYDAIPVVPVPPRSCKAHPEANHYTKLPLVAHRCAGFDVDGGRAWLDSDLDGDLEDETPIALTAHRDQDFTWWLDAPLELSVEGESLNAHPRIQVNGQRALLAQQQWVALVELDGKPVLVGVESVDGNPRSPMARTGLDYNGNGQLDPRSFEWRKRGRQLHWPGNDAIELRVDDTLTVTVHPSDAPAPALFYGQPVPPLDGVDIDGVKRSHSALRGEPFLIEFWASWCGPCIRDLPSLKRLAAKQDLEIYSVMWDSQRVAKRTAKRYGLPWTPIAWGTGPFPDVWGVHGVPYYVLVDAEGKVRHLGHDLDSVQAAAAGLGG